MQDWYKKNEKGLISFFSLKALFDHEPADQSCELHIADPPRMSSRKAAPKLLGSLGTLDLGPWDLDGDLPGDLDEDLAGDLDGDLDGDLAGDPAGDLAGDLDGDHAERESTLLEILASIGE